MMTAWCPNCNKEVEVNATNFKPYILVATHGWVEIVVELHCPECKAEMGQNKFSDSISGWTVKG